MADALRLNPFENDLRALRRLMRANQFAAIEFGARIAQQMLRRENRDHSDLSLLVERPKPIAVKQYVKKQLSTSVRAVPTG